jgi:hypothetical protein
MQHELDEVAALAREVAVHDLDGDEVRTRRQVRALLSAALQVDIRTRLVAIEVGVDAHDAVFGDVVGFDALIGFARVREQLVLAVGDAQARPAERLDRRDDLLGHRRRARRELEVAWVRAIRAGLRGLTIRVGVASRHLTAHAIARARAARGGAVFFGGKARRDVAGRRPVVAAHAARSCARLDIARRHRAFIAFAATACVGTRSFIARGRLNALAKDACAAGLGADCDRAREDARVVLACAARLGAAHRVARNLG